jgi:dihydropyrimidinase
MNKLIKNGTIITAETTTQADVLISGEKIAAIKPQIEDSEAEVIDATGLLILPGGVDPHVHLDLPMGGTVSSDDHYTGTKAAAFGGTTTVIDFISHEDGTLAANVARHRALADPKVCVDYGLHMNVTRFHQGIPQEIADLPATGVTSVKVFTAYNGRLRLDDAAIFQVMRAARKSAVLPMVHAENGDIIDLLVGEALAEGHTEPIWHARTRPAWGEVESALRAFAIGAQAGSPVYLVHMNVAEEVDQLAYARSKGLPVMGETCPQYLFFTEAELTRPDAAKWICSPPLRLEKDQRGLWQGLEAGTIQVLATDHCPFFFDGTQPIMYEGKPVAIPGKELGRANFTQIPNGLPGVADRLPVFWTHAVGSRRITPNQFVSLTATNPARIFGLYPQKGTVAVGSDADLALWDPQKKVAYGVQQAQQRTDYNLYEGWPLTGLPVVVLLRGEVIVRDGRWSGQAGQGKFIHRTSGEIL